ncbi:MAG TPA: DUF308 domain-containing protein, partial [Actinophytocola sp.]|nr:DUF308 domain-containing protein [Actinophytocola sp.]
APLRTIAMLVLLFGLSCIVSGALSLFHAFTGGGGWVIVSGVVSIVMGIVVLSYPVSSVTTLIWLFGIALVALGLTEVVSALRPARRGASAAAAPPPAAPAAPA